MLTFVIYCVSVTLVHSQLAANIQVKTLQGTVQGDLASDGSYYTFYNLFYGGDTSGSNRFKSPTPAPTYPGLYHAVNNNIICAQPTSRGLLGTENCLVLNVFTKNITTPKPVLVWLVAEEYTNSAPVQSFKSFVEEDVVVVQINHRLSIFGFLCLGVEDAPGNAGLKDIVQGLKWIQINIAGFGGDPNNVILFGHGSGAAMVDLITMSPLARNLVHKAIAQSGSALSPWAISYDPVSSATAVGQKLEYTNKRNDQLAKLLVNTDITILSNALNDFDFLNNSILFAPCIENANLNSNDTFLTDAPINILRSGNYSQIPYIAGYVDREGTIKAEEAVYNDWLTKMQANFSNALQVDLDFGNNLTSAERTIREYYFQDKAISMETIEDYLNYQGDTLILVSVIRGARERAATSSNGLVRLYEFQYRGTLNSDWSLTTIPIRGARHSAILKHLLMYDLKPILDEPVSESLIRRYLGFFKDGNPIQSIKPGKVWEPISNSSFNYLVITGGDGPVESSTYFDEIPRVNPHQQRMTFWDDLYFKYYRVPKSVSGSSRLAGALAMLFIPLFVFKFV